MSDLLYFRLILGSLWKCILNNTLETIFLTLVFSHNVSISPNQARVLVLCKRNSGLQFKDNPGKLDELVNVNRAELNRDTHRAIHIRRKI